MQIRLLGVLACFLMALSACQSLPGASPDKVTPARYEIGQATVYALQDVVRAMSVDIFLGTTAEDIKKLAQSDNIPVPSSISAFLIKMGDRLILVDTGLGQSDAPKSMLLEKLVQRGFQPEQVTHVLLTHLHGDHVGGLAWEGKAAFPNAQVLVGKDERDYWLSTQTLKKNPNRKGNIELIKHNFALYGDRVKTFAFDQEVLPGIKALSAVGHTPGHTAFMLTSQDKEMLFWGDLVHGAALQFSNPQISASYDMNAQQAVATRKNFMEMAATRGIPVAGAHLPLSSVIKVDRGTEGSFTFAPY